jgi:hypothetical protein
VDQVKALAQDLLLSSCAGNAEIAARKWAEMSEVTKDLWHLIARTQLTGESITRRSFVPTAEYFRMVRFIDQEIGWTVTANGVTWTIQNDVSSGFWAIYDGGAYVAERGQGSVNLNRALARKMIG